MEKGTGAAPVGALLALLAEEHTLLDAFEEKADAQRRALKENLNGKAVAAATDALAPELARLGTLAEKKESLLRALGCPTMAEAVARQPYSRDKMEARRRVESLGARYRRLGALLEASRGLLSRGAGYLTFSLNVLAAASAAPGYGTPEEPAPALQGRKLFDQSV